MQKIPLITARAGMILARDVFRDELTTGMPICGKDTELTTTLIARLESLKVQSLYVMEHPAGEARGRSLNDLLGDLDSRFAKVRQDPLSAKLHDIFADYLKRTMGESGGQ